MRISRRTFLKEAGALALASPGCAHPLRRQRGVLVNDVQSRLNATQVERVVDVQSLRELESAIRRAAENAKPLSVCGGRHAMGGQQFLTDRLLLDMTQLRRVLKFDSDRGT